MPKPITTKQNKDCKTKTNTNKLTKNWNKNTIKWYKNEFLWDINNHDNVSMLKKHDRMNISLKARIQKHTRSWSSSASTHISDSYIFNITCKTNYVQRFFFMSPSPTTVLLWEDGQLNRKRNKLALYGTDTRLFTTDVSAKFMVTWHKN